MLQHGEFMGWVKKNCAFSHNTAMKYIRVAKLGAGKITEVGDFNGGIDAFLDAHANRRNAPIPTPTDLSQDDASHALKLRAMAERGATEGERDVARGGQGPLGRYMRLSKKIGADFSEVDGGIEGFLDTSLRQFLGEKCLRRHF